MKRTHVFMLTVAALSASLCIGASCRGKQHEEAADTDKQKEENVDNLFSQLPSDSCLTIIPENLLGKWTLAYTEIKYGGMLNEVVRTDIADSEYDTFTLTLNADSTLVAFIDTKNPDGDSYQQMHWHLSGNEVFVTNSEGSTYRLFTINSLQPDEMTISLFSDEARMQGNFIVLYSHMIFKPAG
ncbi:MAG: hypothetical protein IJV13_06020 [Prevotella sp.]|nr:hypothetical protein [Prevotella sp.]